MKIAVVGGGIGGLAAALGLLKAGFDVEVYEQDRKKVIPTDTKTLQSVRVLQPGRGY